MNDRRRNGLRDKFDVTVVGAGLAGTMAALRLAQAGLAVAIVERIEPPRYKTCGGGLVLRARQSIGLDLEECVERECGAELHFTNSGLSFKVDSEAPVVTMTMRADLDKRLLDEALQAGARLHAPSDLSAIEALDGGLLLHSSAEAIETSYVIAADGVGGRTAVLAGWTEKLRLIPAIESEMSVDPETLERFSLRARFDVGVLPSGYAWVFPKRAHLSVGCLTFSPRGIGLKKALEAYLAWLRIQPHHREDHGFAIPIAPRARSLARGRVLLVGDTAGLVDPLTCEGISNTLSSAQLAAAAVLRHGDRPDQVRNAYDRSLRSEILSELRLARVLAYGLYGLPRLRDWLFLRAGDSICRHLSQVAAGQATYRALLGRPSNYLRLLRRLLSS